MYGKSTSCALVRDILEWNVPEEVLAVLLKDRSTGNCRHFGTYCRVMDWNTGEPVEFRAIAENGGKHG